MQGLSMIVSKEQWVGFSSFQVWDIENFTNFANKIESSVKITLENKKIPIFLLQMKRFVAKKTLVVGHPPTQIEFLALSFIFLQKLFKLPTIKRLPFEGLKFEP